MNGKCPDVNKREFRVETVQNVNVNIVIEMDLNLSN